MTAPSDIKRAITSAALAVALLHGSPEAALAKGGGSGGSSSSSSSYSSSSSSSSSSSYYYSAPSPPAEPPLPAKWLFSLDRTYLGTPAATAWYCIGMPNVGEQIQVLVSPYDRYTTPVYANARVEKVATRSCQFEASTPGQSASLVIRYDGTNLLSTLAFASPVVIYLIVLAGAYSYSSVDERAGFNRFSDDIVALGKRFQAKRAAQEERKPAAMVSGVYTGDTSESDGVEQEASTKLIFQDDGRVTGSGFDSEDGKFTIVDGYWCERGAVWFESYPIGPKPNSASSWSAFKVACRVEYNPLTSALFGQFCSSVRSIRGRFTLRPVNPSGLFGKLNK